MKRIVIFLTSTLCALCACSRAVTVTSSDGDTYLGYCDTEITTCIDRFCPQGSRPIRGATMENSGALIVRCLDIKAAAPGVDANGPDASASHGTSGGVW